MNLKFIINIITVRFRGVFAKLKQLISFSKIRMGFQSTFVKFFRKLSDVKPRNQKDYFNVFAWQISKRIAYLLICIVGVLCFVYVFNLAQSYISSLAGDGIRAYRYSSVLLKFASGEVKIKARSGYIAYQGDVKKGYCEGTGSLYRKDGSLVYTGDFSSSKYNGTGDLYYPNGSKEYSGEFVDNLYNGEGTLYRENNSTEYIGEFVAGYKDGEGTLYNTGSTPIYTGTFSKDNIVYSELLGGTTADAAEHYTGDSEVYTYGDEFFVDLSEINAAYLGSTNEDALEDSATVSAVYVLSSKFQYGDETIDSISELKNVLDMPTYEGNAYVNLGEAECINILNRENGEGLSGMVSTEDEEILEGYTQVDSYDDSYMIYLYVYEKDGLVYSFVAPEKGADFEFYYIQIMDDSDDSEDSTEESEE